MVFRLVGQLPNKLKVAPKGVLPAAVDPLADWCAKMFVAARVRYILLTNTASLYSVIVPGGGVTTAAALIEHTFAAIGERMCRDGWTDAFCRFILPSRANVEFSKALGRSVTGSMADIARCAAHRLSRQGATIAEVERQVNNMPLGSIGYRFASEAMADLIARNQ